MTVPYPLKRRGQLTFPSAVPKRERVCCIGVWYY